MRQRHSQKREKDILREERPRGRELEASFNLKFQLAPLESTLPIPPPTLLPCLWAPLLPPVEDSGCLFCPSEQPSSSSPMSLSLPPLAMLCIGGLPVAMARASGGIEGTLYSTLPYSPVHEAFLPPVPAMGPSCFSYDPPPLSVSLWGPLLLYRAHFPSFVVLFPLLSLREILQPLPLPT